MTDPKLVKMYKYIKAYGGYCAGLKAYGAWKEAKQAYLAMQCGFEVKWEYEQEDWMSFAGDPEDEYRKNFDSGKWVCMHAYVEDETGNVLASLGGIVLEDSPNETYKLCVEYELLAEAMQAVKQAS